MTGTDTPIRIGVSSCLLGAGVRYDGGHKHDPFLTQTLGPFFEWVAVCPEVELGLGVPRPALRLIGVSGAPRLVVIKSGEDLTDRMTAFSRRRVRELEALDLCGYILKKDSPSCGMERVKVRAGDGPGVRKGVGLFARELMAGQPMLPVEEEGRLNDPALRENFIERVFCYRRWRTFVSRRWRPGDLVAFHTDHKLLLMAHSPAHYVSMGRIVSAAARGRRAELQSAYGNAFMEALARPATARRNANVFFHALGYFKKLLGEDERREMFQVIESYRSGLVPLIVPITLLRHHVRRFDVAYLARQIWLSPHPAELMLRNHA
ncbi:MAG TPA: DUF523 and DUF1722 domain-containing protein [Candidatus Polarisedimenticolia bacterium]|nr:DUF523 and DUF1722 domain-containing protein [Candidatus Polarisedimenticolia bacterium]